MRKLLFLSCCFYYCHHRWFFILVTILVDMHIPSLRRLQTSLGGRQAFLTDNLDSHLLIPPSLYLSFFLFQSLFHSSYLSHGPFAFAPFHSHRPLVWFTIRRFKLATGFCHWFILFFRIKWEFGYINFRSFNAVSYIHFVVCWDIINIHSHSLLI